MAGSVQTWNVNPARPSSWRSRSRQPGNDPCPAGRRATYRAVFTVGEFRALWAAMVLSVAGDRVALVALALLVYDRTRSPLLGAVAYAAGTVPYAAGSLFLAGIADRIARRKVMVACDLCRASLVTVMLLPHMPIWVLVVMLYAVTTIQPAFDSARSAILPNIVDGERYALAVVIMQTSFRLAIVAGTSAAGVLVALLGTRAALGADAATFVVSALLIRFGMHARPAADSRPGQRQLARLAAGARLVFGDPALRTLVLLGWLAAAYAVPAGIAAPYAASIGGGPRAAGLLIAAAPAGTVLVAPIFTRMAGPPTRLRWMGPMAACGCAVLTLVAFRPPLAASVAILAVSGGFSAYQVAANTAFAMRVPDEHRAQAFGLAGAGLIGGQGVAFMVAGAAAQVMGPAAVIAWSGALGTAAAAGLAINWKAAHAPPGDTAGRQLTDTKVTTPARTSGAGQIEEPG